MKGIGFGAVLILSVLRLDLSGNGIWFRFDGFCFPAGWVLASVIAISHGQSSWLRSMVSGPFSLDYAYR